MRVGDKDWDWHIVGAVVAFLEDNEQYGDDWSEQKKGLNDLLAEVKRLRYLEKYEPAFQVYASIDDERNDDGDPIGEPMPELKHLSGSDEFHYIGFDSVKECEEYIADLPKGWWGHIEVIEWYELARNPQLKTLSEWQESEEE